MDASQLRYLEIVHSCRNPTIASFYVPKVSEMLRNTPKHHFGSNAVEWMLLDFGAPKKCIQSRNTSFASFYVPKVSNALKPSQTSFLVKCSRMVASQLQYLEIVHSGPKHNYCIFYAEDEATWEREDELKAEFPDLFPNLSESRVRDSS
jgi:hypothetical protein